MVALLLAAFLTAVQADPILPTTEGTTWEYQVTGARAGGERTAVVVRIAGKEQADGVELLTLETTVGGELTKTELIAVDERGIVCYRRTGARGLTGTFDPPQTLVPASLKIGTSWELDDQVEGSLMHQQFRVIDEEEITTGAGTFNTFHLHCEQPWPMAVTVDRWFAPGTGLIKDITVTRGPSGRLLSRTTTVLQKLSVTVAPTPAPTSRPSATPAQSPEISVVVAAERDGEPRTEFKSDVPNIFVRWNGQHLPMNSYVRVAWIAEDVGAVAPANFVVDENESEVTSPEFGARFTLSRPKDGWAAGKYRLELYLDEELRETIRVSIAD